MGVPVPVRLRVALLLAVPVTLGVRVTGGEAVLLSVAVGVGDASAKDALTSAQLLMSITTNA